MAVKRPHQAHEPPLPVGLDARAYALARWALLLALASLVLCGLDVPALLTGAAAALAP